MNPRYVAITQRVTTVPHRGETGDYLDQRWIQRLAEQQLAVLPLPNHPPTIRHLLQLVPIRMLILSGGNNLATLPDASDTYPHRDEAELVAIELAAAQQIPVLGVCRGAQLLAARLGAHLVRRSGHAGTQHSVRTMPVAAPMPWTWPARFEVTSHHDWVITKRSLPAGIKVLAEADDGTVEAFTHPTERQWGLMWHPEREPAGGYADRVLQHLAGGQ
ncbi:putative glutamine amidotransferase [Kribbella aluminosa]|uniref:Glutamine amidotransferase n=1 Tax=Kribbella aluminosa TaxID=416017 RepID=A0ABS4UNV4_9ACTN|nr:gamma-glutamyl-gamma-aminobutyrate hydrolase family protein [Kribbella aluminosa]MBP2353294.1 putative glutamine amidotransferase [Kribbella aluminosa]